MLHTQKFSGKESNISSHICHSQDAPACTIVPVFPYPKCSQQLLKLCENDKCRTASLLLERPPMGDPHIPSDKQRGKSRSKANRPVCDKHDSDHRNAWELQQKVLHCCVIKY